MASLNRFMRGGISQWTQNVDRIIQPTINFNANARYKTEDIQKILELRDAQPMPFTQLNADRSWLDRGFDALLMPNYMVAGAVDGMIRDDKTVLEGVWGGMKAGNPFGAGFEEGETTFSNVLESGGWKDDAFWGSNVLRGTAGFVLDVLFDPTTYMTFGLGAALKGTGHVGKASKTLVELGERFPEFAQGLKAAGELTDEMAEEIVKRANGITSPAQIADNIDDIGKVDRTSEKFSGAGEMGQTMFKMSRAQFNQEVTEFKSTYNKMLGVGRTGKGITIGVQNMPFGDWVAKKLNITSQPKTLIKDSTIRKISDATGTSRAYAMTREAFYGSKIGTMLSRTAGLKKLGQAEPEKIYEFIAGVNKLQGKDLDKLARERHIKELGNTLLKLSPAEQKKIIKALENPSLWQRVTDVVRGADSSAWTKLQDNYRKQNDELLAEARKMQEMRNEYINASEDQLREYRQVLSQMDKENLTAKQQELIKKMDDDMRDLIAKHQESIKPFEEKDYATVIKNLEEELGQVSTTYNEMKDEFFEGVESAYAHLEPADLAKVIDEKFTKINVSKKDVLDAEDYLKSLGKSDAETVGEKAVDDVAREEASKLVTNARLARQASVNELREVISEYLFGRKNVIPRNIDAGKLESIAQAVKFKDDPYEFHRALQGEHGGTAIATMHDDIRNLSQIIMEHSDPTDALRALVREQGTLLTDDVYAVYSYLARRYGYDSINNVRNRIKDLTDKLEINLLTGRPKKPLTTPEQFSMWDEFTSLTDMVIRRNKELKEIMKIPATERVDFVKNLEYHRMADEMYETLFGEIDNRLVGSKIIEELSDTREQPEYAGTKYDKELNIEDMSYAEEAKAIGREVTQETEELARFRQSKADKPYTTAEVAEHSFDDIKASVLEARHKALFQRSLTPEAREGYKVLGSLEKRYRDIVERYRVAKSKGASEKYLNQIQIRSREIMDDINAERERLRRETNLFSVAENLKNLSREEIEFVSAQVQAGLLIQEKLFSHHQFKHLTSKQKSFLTGLSYSLTKKYVDIHGVPKRSNLDDFREFLEKEGVKKVNKETSRIAKERAEVAQETLVREKITYDSGVEIKVGDEVVRGVVHSIKEDKRPIYRERVEVEYTTDDLGELTYKEVEVPRIDKKTGKPRLDKNGKPIMRKELRPVQIPPQKTRHERKIREKVGEEGLGSYTYDVRLADGSIVNVKPAEIVGTYADEFYVEKVAIPKHTEEELDGMIKYMEGLKNKIRAYKGQATKQSKAKSAYEEAQAPAIARLESQIADLVKRKTEANEKLSELMAMEKANQEALDNLIASSDLFGKKADEYDEAYKELMARYDEINKALDDNDLFEMLVKLDMGEDGYAEWLRNSEEIVSGDKMVIDIINDYDEHMKNRIKKIRQDLMTAGFDEVAVGKLDQGAFETMADRYFPRTLSAEGKAYFDANPDQIEKYASVAQEYGFGKEFTPHGKARSEEMKKQGIFEANDFFESEIGVRVFEENLGQAYVNRMLTSTEVVYDQRAMEDLMFRFGYHTLDGIKKGYEAVANYGMLKKYVREQAFSRARQLGFKGDELYTEAQRQAHQIMDEFGLDRKILDGETTPFIKLTDDQVARINQQASHLARQVNSMTIDRANQARALIMERDEKAMLKLYDKFMTFFKLNQTTVMPAFHVRNHLGAMFVGWLGVGKEAVNIKTQKTALDALKLFGKDMELRNLRPVSPDNPGGKTYYWDEIMNLATTFRVIDQGFMMKDFAAHSYSQGTRIIPGKFDPFNTSEFLPYKIGSKIATYSDNINRLTQFSALLKQGKTPLEASQIVTKYMFDYADLTTFEKRWMKRIFPYYTYMRKNLPLMSNEFLENSEKLALVGKIHNGIEGMATDEERVGEDYKMGFAQDWLSMPFRLNSSTGLEPVLMNPNMPYMQLRDLPTGDIGDTARTFFSQTAPMLKVPIELATNWNSFFDAPIATEDGDQVSPKLVHVMSQLAAFNAVKQFVTGATMDDKVLSLINTGTGVKMTTYDLENAKKEVFEQAYESEYKLTIQNLIGSGIRFSGGLLDATGGMLSDMAINLYGEPYSAFGETGALAPISQTTFEKLPDEEKALYTLDEETKSYLHNRAIEFEREQYEQSGIMKKFATMLIKDDFADKAVVHVDKVTDGDTFVARQGDETFNVRLLLVDTPESKGDYKDNPQFHSLESAKYTEDMILGKDVKLYLDESTTYGRRLAFVEIGGKSLQEELVREGQGKVRLYDENYTDEAEALYNLEEDAYKEKKGIWSGDGNAVPRSNTGFIR